MSKHRPGPWILSESSVLRYGDTKETKICEIFCNRNNKLIAEIPDYCYHAEDAEQDRADARLLTAAPELLETIQALLAEMEKNGSCMYERLREDCAAAVAKATA